MSDVRLEAHHIKRPERPFIECRHGRVERANPVIERFSSDRRAPLEDLFDPATDIDARVRVSAVQCTEIVDREWCTPRPAVM